MLDINRQLGHQVKITAPFYALASGTQLHRYMETDFIGRYQQALSRKAYDSLRSTDWQAQDRFGRYKDQPTLRQAIHRTFYVVSCEVSCVRLGEPALDPQSITSAGFVLRRVGGGHNYGWMVEDGEPIGWKPVESEQRDPDIYRRLCRNGRLKILAHEPSFSGEEIHPLHPTTVYDDKNKRHTLLFGYLPLGGSYYLRQNSTESPFDSSDEALLVKEHYWPFGTRDRSSWSNSDARPVSGGRPTLAFYYLLRVLVNRYHIGDTELEGNDLLEETLKGINFYTLSSPYFLADYPDFSDSVRSEYDDYKSYSLWDYLTACFQRGTNNPLFSWLDTQDKKLEGLPAALLPTITMDKLPTASSGEITKTLYLSQGDAEELRALLTERVRSAAVATAREIPIGKFQQGAEDIYQLVPFVRHLDKDGNEQITWGTENPSIQFRVAAPFDPEASRPSLIPIPGLDDLRRGLAKGASFLIPPDTMQIFNSLKLSKGASADVIGSPGAGLGIQWICSFSLPIVTLVAMILLMIMVALLNIVFWWMPFVRICLPFPKLK